MLVSFTRETERPNKSEHWEIHIAYEWLATIIFTFSGAAQARRKAPEPQLLELHSHSRLDA